MIRADGLVRALRRRDLVALLLHAMMGAGMLVAPSRVFGYVGDWSFVALGALHPRRRSGLPLDVAPLMCRTRRHKPLDR